MNHAGKPTDGLFAELNRRKVTRVGLMYCGVAFVVLQVADITFPALGIPGWGMTLVVMLVVLGFPVALMLAWAYEIRPEGIVRDTGQFAVAAPAYQSIAVLPFDDMSEARDQAWFAEGMAEEIINALAQMKSLRVMARTSSFAVHRSGKTVAEISEILKVDAVLDGSVRRVGDRVRIIAELIDSRQGHHLWSDSFDEKMEDIFSLQEKLSRAIVEALKVELGVASTAPMVVVGTTNQPAYEAFLQGRRLYNWANPANFEAAIGHFERAVQLDSRYAKAWGCLAHAVIIAPAFGRDDQESLRYADQAVHQALASDPEQSEALAVSAAIAQLRDHDWIRAGTLYRRALRDSDNGNARVIYGVLFLPMVRRFDEAFALYRETEERDPLHAGFKTNYGVTLRFAGRFDEAIAKFEEAIALDPMHVFAWSNLILTYLGKAIWPVPAVIPRIPPVLQQIPNIRQRVGQIHARDGDPRARLILDEMLADKVRLRGRLGLAAALACDVGENEICLDLLEASADSLSWTKLFAFEAIRADSPLRDHPRFKVALRKIGLDAESIAATNAALDTMP